jgi:hypothetical protein
MEKKRNPGLTKRNASEEGEALDALNLQVRRTGAARRLIEADIEARSKKRRNDEKPASSGWSRNG